MTEKEAHQLDNWIENGESRSGHTTGKRLFKKSQNPKLFPSYEELRAETQRILSEQETREAKQRRLYAEREAERTGEAQRKRYVNHILSVMPTQNNVQRMPCISEFCRRVDEAYHSITHDPSIYHEWQSKNYIWQAAVSEVKGILHRNQSNVIAAYVKKFRDAQAAGQTDLKAIWQEIAHYADKDDIDLKYGIWKAMCLPYARCF